MKRISDAIKTEIRVRLNLAEVLREDGVSLTRSGKEWRGRCPFEPESTNPSKFAVNERTYYCYGCEASGDIFSWLQRWKDLRFPDAVAEAARRANLTLPSFDDEQPHSAAEAARLNRQVKRARAAQEALVILAELSYVTARGGADRHLCGIAVDSVIETGELGCLPSALQVQQRLDALGISQQARVDVGIRDALDASAGRWVLWARRAEQIVGGRTVELAGDAAPLRFGVAGSKTHGWIQASLNERGAQPLIIAGDDLTYLALRSMGRGSVYRPLSPESLVRTADGPRGGGDRSSPVYVLRPTENERRRAFDDLIPLLAAHPRCRVVELDALAVSGSDATARRAMLDAAIEHSGTAFDWQTHVLASHRAFESYTGRLAAATRLGQVATATTSPIERLTYALEIEALTGVPWNTPTMVEQNEEPARLRTRVPPPTVTRRP